MHNLDRNADEKAVPLSARPTTDQKSWFAMIETVVLGLILLVPVLGTFSPPDIWLNYPGEDISSRDAVGALPLDQIFVRTTAAVSLFWALRNWRGYLTEIKYSALILLQLTAFASSFFWSEVPGTTFAEIYNLGIVSLLLLYIVHTYSIRQFVRLLTQVFGVSAFCSIFVLVFFPGMAHNLGSADYLGAWRGAYVQKNPLGMACSLGVLTATYSWYIRANSRIFASLVVFASAVLLVGSDSVTSMLTTVLGLSLYGIAFLSRSFLGRLILLFISAGAGIVALAILTSETNLAGLVGRTSGLTGRTYLWQVVEGFIVQRPVHGYGLGFWMFRNQDQEDLWLQVDWAPPEAHNDVLDVLLQTGYVGLAFYFLNNFTALFLGLRRFTKLQDGSIFCLVIVAVFFYRSYTETASVISSGKTVLLLYVAEAYIYKLAFSGRSVSKPTSEQRSLQLTSSAISG